MAVKSIGNFHLHSTGSDGKLSPEQVIKRAIELGLPYICFTDHYPYPPEFDLKFKNAFEWSHFHNKGYYEQILKLKQEYKNQIKVYFGAEFNWIENYEDWLKKEIQKRDYDYALISIHKIPKGNNSHPINWKEEIFQEIVEYYGDIKKVVKEYYKQVRLAANTGLFDSIAHFDIIKCWNKDSKYFNEQEDWYKQEVLKTLDVISDKKMCIEINTSNWRTYYPVDEQCPSSWILKEMKKRNIPIIIGSDAHDKEEIGSGLDRAVKLAKQLGYTSILKFKNRKRIEIPI